MKEYAQNFAEEPGESFRASPDRMRDVDVYCWSNSFCNNSHNWLMVGHKKCRWWRWNVERLIPHKPNMFVNMLIFEKLLPDNRIQLLSSRFTANIEPPALSCCFGDDAQSKVCPVMHLIRMIRADPTNAYDNDTDALHPVTCGYGNDIIEV